MKAKRSAQAIILSLSEEDKETLEEYYKKIACDTAEKEFWRMIENDEAKLYMRFLKIMSVCLAMDEQRAAEYGLPGWKKPWGCQRIGKLIDMVQDLGDYLDANDEIAWEHINKRLEQIGVIIK